jgi:hypothetical protein
MAITFDRLAPPANHILVTLHDGVPVPKVIVLEQPSRPDERVFPLQFLRRDLARLNHTQATKRTDSPVS